ncbi:putative hemoglobin protein (Truncated hemoglobin) [Bradyrhizobium sp. ORS 278]|uniref:group II truncated hemoglobin n=1 Tax=Bradyrhizobium sp. (strain ORS 278) TaxID=114615 RepID=UPI000150829C|nr:group II truncated hemoglobin [Bradyrhizobium sp. ORS 278]CAL79083.1 putative hemoglobin protein (Truncated hemoglobin) [Bradyrhizobium sp. ORS 278]
MADAGTTETDTSATGPVITPYERIGGAAVIDRLVESFYHRMDTLPEAKTIRDMHGTNLGPIKVVLKRYLSEWLGGPKLYSPEKGHPRLRQRHMGFPIGNAERDAWLLCMRGALDETVADVAARQDVDAAMTKLADWMRNQAGNPHDARAAPP